MTASWRPIALLAVIALFLTWQRLPLPLLALLLAGAGAYLLYRGWQGWTGRTSGRVTYWRGRRIELEPARAGGSWPRVSGGTILSLAAGAGLMLMALLMLVQRGLS